MLPEHVTIRQLAGLLNVDERTIRRWQNPAEDDAEAPKSPIPHEKDGRSLRFPLAACVQWYADHRARQAAKALSELDMEKREKLAVERRIKEVELAQLLGEVLTLEDFRREVGSAYDAVRARLLAFPGRAGPMLVGVKSVAEAVARLEPLIREILEELAGEAVSRERGAAA